MTFRELLEKYRAGQASEEERALVEAELEKRGRRRPRPPPGRCGTFRRR